MEQNVIITNPFADLWRWTCRSVINAIRSFNFRAAKAEADRLCKINNRKYYVIEASKTNYTVFSTADVRRLKKMRVFRRNLSFIELSNTAAYVAYPK